MGQQSLSQARVSDPILSAVARGYLSQNAAIADMLFPIVTVGVRAGRILSFGPDDFKLVNTVRAPGSGTKRIQFGYGSEKFSLVDHRLEGAVPRENAQEAEAVPGIDLGANAVRRVQNVMALERENQAAVIATNAANYDSSNKVTLLTTDKWTDPASDPFTDINDAKEVVRSQIGVRPNSLALGPKVLTGLRSHPKILDRLSTASDRPPATITQLAALFELDQIREGTAVHHDGTGFVDTWGKDAVLAYTTPRSMQEMGSPSYGYTYRYQGMPDVEEPYFDNNTVTWFYPVTDAYQAVLAGKAAGFLFKGAAA